MAKSNEYNNILKDWINPRQSFIYSIFMILLVDLFSRNRDHYVSRIFYIFAELTWLNANRTYFNKVGM